MAVLQGSWNSRAPSSFERTRVKQVLTNSRRPEIDVAMQETPIKISPKAVEEIGRILKTKNVPEEYFLRVGVRGGGCSGMSYILGFDKKREYDLEFVIDGVTVVMDKRQGLYLMGMVIDYHDGLSARGFTFENPNATTTCGCGSSFAA